MFALIVVALCSLLVSFFLTPFFRDFFGFLEMVDRPNSDRKIHARPVPRVGGIPLVVSYFLSAVALIALGGQWRAMFNGHDPSIQLMIRLMPAVALIFATGLYDDIRGLTPGRKLAGQLAAASYAYWAGVRLETPPGYSPILIALVSILWLVFCANAINLIDGIDGLAAGVALLATISLLMASLLHHHPGLALTMAPLVGGLLGFLCYNFNPASVFLGDSGSLLCGFLLGCAGLMWNRHASTGLGRAAPLVALAFPAAEVMLSISRRFLRNRPIFAADRNHIHHRILSMAFSQRSAALILYGEASRLQVPLSPSGSITFGRDPSKSELGMLIGPFVGALQAKLVAFASERLRVNPDRTGRFKTQSAVAG
jgi:UDP-GlcNAc:undecaprenyl-phosphate/decaprenyl-phosphate GlcNAc-1-phosphate transferase